MKVLISTDTIGGVLTYTTELAAALEAAGDEVVVATMGAPLRPAQRRRLPACVHESDFALEWMEDPWVDVAAAGEWLRELAQEERPDVVHLCSYAHGSVSFRAPKLLVAHSCVLSWWRAVHATEAPPSWNRYREETAAGLEAADAVVAPSQAMLTELERDHELDPGSATVIHNGSGTSGTRFPAPHPPANPNCIKFPTQQRGNLMQFAGEGRLVLGSGRFWDPAKNLAALDAAAEGLAWPVVVAGDLGDGESPRHAEATGLLDGEELAALRRQASIYAAPAVYEPFGLGILEAARDGCALVLGDIPSLRELWGDAAIFVDPRDVGALHAVLACLIEAPQVRADLGERARRRAAAYSIERTAAAYRRLYQRLALRERV
ncbi:MAG TPA: glycosyltransferase family 4 protein [Solirubrobacterales bacterium]|nr:glycosyltransferase family 4 protein [Solirubrobacterales bacterium]